MTFAALFVSKKREEKRIFSLFEKRHLIRHASRDTFSRRRRLSSAFSFAKAAAKEKVIKKKSAERRFRALRSATRATCP